MEIVKPTLLLDKERCLENIKKMAEKAQKANVRFRPHFKTHQSAEIGSWFRNYGVDSITVSSIIMANLFVESGWKDITVAFPVNIREIDHINALAGQIQLNLTFVMPETVKLLDRKLIDPINAYIKIDTGYHRTGILAEDIDEIDNLIKTMESSKRIRFKGFLTHDGHTYKARSKAEILGINKKSLKMLTQLKEHFQTRNRNITISIGDTPSCSIVDNFEGIDEFRPGNFVFYDLMQWQLGSCKPTQIALAMACPVVAKHSQRQEIIIYGGAVQFSKDFILDQNGERLYGYAVEMKNERLGKMIQDIRLKAISQEHGILKTNEEQFENIKIGDLVYILPVHSCLTANLYSGYLTLTNDFIKKMW